LPTFSEKKGIHLLALYVLSNLRRWREVILDALKELAACGIIDRILARSFLVVINIASIQINPVWLALCNLVSPSARFCTLPIFKLDSSNKSLVTGAGSP
jgi:hypothetical protein